MPRIYISNRPEDTSRNEVVFIHEQLVRSYGEKNVFQSTGSNSEITTNLERLVKSCHFMLIVIGKYWLDMMDEDGERLLDDPFDPIRVEIETGSKARIPTAIILVDDASLPSTDDLPPSLHSMLDQRKIGITSINPLDTAIRRLIEDMSTGKVIFLPEYPYTMKWDTGHKPSDSNAPTKVGENNLPQLNSSRRIPLYVWIVPISLILCGALIVGAWIISDWYSIVPSIQFEHIRLLVRSNTTDLGYIPFNGHMYFIVDEDGNETTVYFDPDAPYNLFTRNTPLENFLQDEESSALTSDDIATLETELGDRFVFTVIDQEDNFALLVTLNSTVYILNLDSLKVESKHRLMRTSVRKFIANETITYNEKNNLLIFLIGSAEINIWEIADSPYYQGRQTVGTESTYIFEFAVDSNGEYLATRGDRGVDLYGIRD